MSRGEVKKSPAPSIGLPPKSYMVLFLGLSANGMPFFMAQEKDRRGTEAPVSSRVLAVHCCSAACSIMFTTGAQPDFGRGSPSAEIVRCFFGAGPASS